MEDFSPQAVQARVSEKDRRSPDLGTVAVYLLFLLLGTPLLVAGLGGFGARIAPQIHDSVAGLVNSGTWLVLAAYVLWVWISAFYYARRSIFRLLVVVLPPVLALVVLPLGHSYGVRAKVVDAIVWSNPHRTALGIACSEEALEPGMDNAALGLAPAERYQGRYTRSIAASVQQEGKGTVTIVLRAISGSGWPVPRRAIDEGETIVYEGTCNESGMTWTVHGTAPRKYWPRS